MSLHNVQRPGAGAPRAIGQFARNSVFGTIAGLSTAFGSVISSVVVAHLLGVEGTGVVAFALLVVMVASAIADFGIQSSLSRYLPELIGAGLSDEAERLTGLLFWALAGACCVALAGFVAYAIWDWQAEGTAREGAAIWGLVGVACALQTLTGFTYGYLRGVQRFDYLARVTVISVAAQLVGIAIGTLSFGVAGALVGYCAGSVLPAALSLRHLHCRGLPSQDIRVRVRRYALYAWAAALSSAFVWSRAEVFFLQRSSGSAAVGLFSVGVTLANLASQGPMLMTAALLPYFAQNFGKDTLAEMRQACAAAMRVLAFLVFPACLGMAAILPTALPLLYGQAFSGAVPAATVLVLASAVGSTSSVGTSLIMAMDRSDFEFFSGAAAAILMIVAGVTVIPTFGLMGAAWSRAVIQVLAVAFGGWFVVSRLGLSLPWRDLARLLVAACVCGAAARACLWLRSGPSTLAVAILAGVVTYVAAIRVLHGLPTSDLDWLRAMSRPLPAGLRSAVELGLRILSGGPRPQVDSANATRQGVPQPSVPRGSAIAAALANLRAGRNAN